MLADHAGAQHPSSWRGKNFLGANLRRVHSLLRNGSDTSTPRRSPLALQRASSLQTRTFMKLTGRHTNVSRPLTLLPVSAYRTTRMVSQPCLMTTPRTFSTSSHLREMRTATTRRLRSTDLVLLLAQYPPMMLRLLLVLNCTAALRPLDNLAASPCRTQAHRSISSPPSPGLA